MKQRKQSESCLEQRIFLTCSRGQGLEPVHGRGPQPYPNFEGVPQRINDSILTQAYQEKY